jgi:hypothetical protein
MDTSEILIAAYDRGRAWNPAYPNLANLDRGRIGKMHGDEPDAKELVKSLQESDANYDPLVLAFHQRFPEYDGEMGPATAALVNIPRCPIPDFAPPPGAAIDLGDPELNAIAESMQAMQYGEASGSGSWPASGCDPERKGMHSIRVRINPARAPANVLSYKDAALKAVVDAYADIGLSVRYLWEAEATAEITKEFANLRGGVIGINYFPQPNNCSRITGQLSTSYAPNDGGKLWANLECHETGHGVGLQHTRGHIMNPSILLVWPLTWRGSPSESTVKRYFGGEPITPTPDDPTKPPPSPTDPEVEVTFTLAGVAYEIRRKIGSRPPIAV